MKKARFVPYKKIKIGDSSRFNVTLDSRAIKTFMGLSGDYNPLHSDASYAAKTKFKKPVVHGMLASLFFSTLVGMYLPGRTALYLGQTLRFKKPMFKDDTITVKGVVTKKSDATHMISLHTTVTNKRGVVCVEGEALVLCLDKK